MVVALNLEAILREPNPYINLELDEYEASARQFQNAVSGYTGSAINEISSRKSAYIADKKRLADRIKQLEEETNQCKVKEINLNNELAREQEERKEAESTVASLKRRLDSLKEKCAGVNTEIEQYRSVTEGLNREKAKERALLQGYASQLALDIRTCETKLHCLVEGFEGAHVLFRFTHLDKSEPAKEYSLILDMSTGSYKVTTSTPLLPSLPILLDKLNNSRDMYNFVKQARHAFLELSEGI